MSFKSQTSVLFLLSLVFLNSCKEKTLFEKLDPEHTGVHFSNRITENDSINILKFEYVYNGSGVGVADFNNDSIPDLFFSANQEKSKLYLGKGDLKYEDVSEKAQIDTKNRWAAGVVTVDINADGLMDVYLACTAKNPASERENLLLVNQGIKNGVPSFKEMAAEYGINDDGHSENAAFFDYDNDGDLDLYVLTNIIDQYPNLFREKKKDGSHPNTDRLYRCDFDPSKGHPVYTNVSKEAGISIEGYGLGLNICDINKDGYKDIYVTNDYISDDLLYINKGNGTFTDQAKTYFKHTSNSAMGNDVADINNDGFLDIVSVDMLAKTNERKKRLGGPSNYQTLLFSEQYDYRFQYMRNMVQLNNGITKDRKPQFSDISLMAGVGETDWSWCPSLADFDNDGYRDLLITNGFPRDVTDRDFVAFRSEMENFADREMLLAQIPVIKIPNFAYRNTGKLSFEDVTQKWGLDLPSFSNGAVYADLDLDGDLDYVVNNINDSAFVYRNTLKEEENKGKSIRISFKGDQKNPKGIGAVAKLFFEDGEVQIHENNPYRGYLSSVEPLVYFGIGNKKVKKLEIAWYNGKKQSFSPANLSAFLVADIKNATEENLPDLLPADQWIEELKPDEPILVHEELDYIDFNLQNLLPQKMSQLGPGISAGDLNQDGLDDAYLCGSYKKPGYLLFQKPDGTFKKTALTDTSESKMEELSSLFVDLDGDDDLDIYLCVGGTEQTGKKLPLSDRIFVNDGKGSFTELKSGFTPVQESSSCARALDYDKDGDLDLIIAGRNVPGRYPEFTDSHLLRNDSKKGQIKLTDVSNTHFPSLKKLGLVCDILATDYDSDGDRDLIVASEYQPIRIFENQKGKFTENTSSGLDKFLGLWTSINGADFDHDGDIDYVVGNIGENTLYKGSSAEPLQVYAKDFDANGVYDIFPFVYFTNEQNKRVQVPFNGKDDVNKMLNLTRPRFVDYKSFATASPQTLLTDVERESAQKLELNHNASVFVKNLGKGRFELSNLPFRAQTSTLLGTLIQDINADGHLDIIGLGNNFGNEISQGRLDASNGMVLLGNGQGGFTYQNHSNFYVPADSKAICLMNGPNNEVKILCTQNRGPLKQFRAKHLQAGENVKSETNTYVFKNLKSKYENYFGSSYLSQSSRRLISSKP
jgi:enediyne biosynthesis protein E4